MLHVWRPPAVNEPIVEQGFVFGDIIKHSGLYSRRISVSLNVERLMQ